MSTRTKGRPDRTETEWTGSPDGEGSARGDHGQEEPLHLAVVDVPEVRDVVGRHRERVCEPEVEVLRQPVRRGLVPDLPNLQVGSTCDTLTQEEK